MEKTRVAAVSYLNTKPFLHGLEQSDLINEMDLQLNIPSDCLDKLLNGEVDMALVPVTALALLDDPHVISRYCIGSTQAVRTVCLFSDVPMEQIDRIMLDYQSSTSVALIKTLAKDHWNVVPQFVKSERGFESEIGGTTAGLVIGDRAIELYNKFEHVYDLGAEWQQFTQLPFVYALWVSNRPLEHGFVERFNAALAHGINSIPKVIESYVDQYKDTEFSLETYFTENISFELDSAKEAGLKRFLTSLTGQLTSISFQMS